MCGICGFAGFDDNGLLDRMLPRLRQRGPDEEGRFVEPGLALGVRRLRVIDPEGGRQPVRNETGTVTAVHNGEIYNYRELRDDLIRKGHRFTSKCDSEVLVHLYEEYGVDGLHRLRGMYAFALWDAERRRLLLVRDRLGIKPLYYAERGAGALVFASDLPALRPALTAPSVSPAAVAEYLTLLYIPGPGTIYEGVQQLLPGEMLTWTAGRIERTKYFAPESLAVGPGSAAERPDMLAERFLTLLRETVRLHLVSDVPLGLFLSGGLDSGALLAMMRSVTDGPIRTFSIGYDAKEDRSYDELAAARLMAERFGTEHHEERLRPNAVDVLPRIVAAMGEPFADSSAIPTYLVSEVARRSVTVALSGIGGDELFGGYPRHLGAHLAPFYRLGPGWLRTLGARLAPRLADSSRSRDHMGRLQRFLRYGHLSIEDQYLAWTTFVPPEWAGSALTDELQARTKLHTLEADHLRRFLCWPSEEPATRAMGVDIQTYLPDDLLRMGDRLSMAHSLELRVPLCDHELLAFALRVPARLRFSGWRLKGFVKNALRGVLPRQILRRPKHGFSVPLARWLREDLRIMVRDLLSEDTIRRRGYVTPSYVRWLISEHEAGRRNLADQLYALVVLELWHRQEEQQQEHQVVPR